MWIPVSDREEEGHCSNVCLYELIENPLCVRFKKLTKIKKCIFQVIFNLFHFTKIRHLVRIVVSCSDRFWCSVGRNLINVLLFNLERPLEFDRNVSEGH